jgi:hypothetical protein
MTWWLILLICLGAIFVIAWIVASIFAFKFIYDIIKAMDKTFGWW